MDRRIDVPSIDVPSRESFSASDASINASIDKRRGATLIDEWPNLAGRGFAPSVHHGLSMRPRRIDSKWLYDAEGARLFEEIVATPAYYVPSAEKAILSEYAAEISGAVGRGLGLLELGSGASSKVRILLDQLESLRCYVPLEISEAQLLEAAEEIRRDYPDLPVFPIVADYTKDFDLPPAAEEGRLMAFFPGSTLCNMLPGNSVAFLRRMRRVVGPGGFFLAGVDLKKDEETMLRAYNDPGGPMWRFNLNILERLNRELGCELDPAAFRHEAIYNREAGRIEAAIYPNANQTLVLEGSQFVLPEGEPIVLEYSHKYRIEEFQALAREAGWLPREAWTDPNRLFSVHLLAS